MILLYLLQDERAKKKVTAINDNFKKCIEDCKISDFHPNISSNYQMAKKKPLRFSELLNASGPILKWPECPKSGVLNEINALYTLVEGCYYLKNQYYLKILF
jgi:hypothetical protein